MAEAETILGLDIGTKRIGVARGSSVARLAAPLAVIDVDGQEIERLRLLVESEQAGRLVIGWPRGLDSQLTAQTKAVERFVHQKLRQLGLPIEWRDEALSTIQAEASFKPSDKFKTADAHAAAIILQDYLDAL